MNFWARFLVFLALACGFNTELAAQSPQAVRKPSVAVARITDTSNSGQAESLKTMIQTAVTETGKFRVIERDFGQLDTEQALARSGRVTSNQPGRNGGYEGVDFIVYGNITSASAGREGDSGADVGNALLGSLLGVSVGKGGCNKASATIATDVKIVDAVTGEVKFAKQITEHAASATACSSNANVDITALMRSIANQTAMGLTITMYPIKVAAVQPDGVFVLNYGEGALKVGTVLGVYGKGPEIRDPDTGALLTSEGAELGRIRVSEVTTRFSKAVPLTPFSSTPPNGSVARVVADQGGGRQKAKSN